MTTGEGLERLCAIAKEQGEQTERIRIAKLIGETPLADCKCDRMDLVYIGHAPDCLFIAEYGFRQRLITAVLAVATGEPENVPVSGFPAAFALSPAGSGDTGR